MTQTYQEPQGSKATVVGFDGAQAYTDLSKAFLEGRSYRMFKEFTADTVIRITATGPFLLTAQNLYVDAGQARVTISVDPTTDTGTWATLATKYQKNGTVLASFDHVTVEEGGAITGGVVRETLRVNASVFIGSAAQLQGKRLLPAGTYYITIDVTGTTSGIYSIEYDVLEVPV